MPLIKSAKKKLKQDKKRTLANKVYKENYKKEAKRARSTSQDKTKGTSIKKAYSAIDKAAKKGVIHKNKAARLKSQVARQKKNK